MRRIAAVVVLIATATAPSLQAQIRDRGLVEVSQTSIRHGVYFGASLGAGREECRLATTECAVLDGNGDPLPDNGNTYRNALTSPALQIRLGGTINPNVRIGGELFGWSGSNGPATERTVGLLLNGQFYPSARSGFYLKGGVGYAWNSFDYNDGSTTPDYSGFMLNVGAGYDIPLNRSVSIAPVVDFYHATYSNLSSGDETERFLFLGVSLTFQSGRRW
jgi:Outer membrane protein beta-barrel domain